MNLMMRAAAMAPLLAANALWAQLPEGSGKALVETRCVGCHDLSGVTRSSYSRVEWLDNVHKMRNVGAKISDSEMETIVDYLARSFPERPRMSPSSGPPGKEGKGRTRHAHSGLGPRAGTAA